MDENLFLGRQNIYWKSDLELENWVDPAFQEFINKEIIPTIKNKKPKTWYWL
jgi:hypothetical protein